jgi:hypothetical protein
MLTIQNKHNLINQRIVLSSEQIKHKQTFLNCIEKVMIMY